MNGFQKRRHTLRTYLLGANFHDALAVMTFVERFHTGTRKDGVTHEFDHQLKIALYALTLPDLMYREEVIATILSHDTPEDYDVPQNEIVAVMRDRDMAARVAEANDTMTKTFRGEKRDVPELFRRMGLNPISSIAKGCDRIDNYQSMPGVFTPIKQGSYLDEGDTLFLPMIKVARDQFPHQRLAYENMKFVMKSQMELIRHSLKALETV